MRFCAMDGGEARGEAMALRCFDGGECDGCMGCYEDETTVSCAVCGRELGPHDDVVRLESGEYICGDTVCLHAKAIEGSTQAQKREYAALFLREFIAMYEWELFEAATRPETAFWTRERKDPLTEFADTDPESFCQWWLDENGYYYHPYADEL